MPWPPMSATGAPPTSTAPSLSAQAEYRRGQRRPPGTAPQGRSTHRIHHRPPRRRDATTPGHQDRQTHDADAFLQRRAPIRTDQTRPRNPTVHPPRTTRRPSRMETDRRHQQPTQALPGQRPTRLAVSRHPLPATSAAQVPTNHQTTAITYRTRIYETGSIRSS